MYRGKEQGCEGKMKGFEEQEMLMRMMMMKKDAPSLNHQYDHQGDFRMMGLSQSGSSSFSGGYGLYGADISDSYNVFNQNMNHRVVDNSSGQLLNSQNFDNLIDMDLSQRLYGLNLDDRCFNGTGNSVSGFSDYQKLEEGLLCDSIGPVFTKKHFTPIYKDLCYPKEQIDYGNLCNMNRPCSNEGLRYIEQIDYENLYNMNRPCSNEGLRYKEHCGIDERFFSSLPASQLMRLNSECECSIANQKAARGHDYSFEDSFIIEEDGVSYFSGQRGLKGHTTLERLQEKVPARDKLLHYGESCEVVFGDTRFQLEGALRNVYLAAKDQQKCRYLQRIFDEGTSEDVQILFNVIVHHIIELMKDPFANYLVQKLLTVCSDDQRMKFVLMVTKDPGELVKASRTTHGTRVVQKLIEIMKSRQEISLVIRALQPGFLELVMDANGNHVIQRCLHCLSKDYNKFIFDGATKHCVEIATHRYGCCVLNKCVDFASGKRRDKLLAEICLNGLKLAQDPFGNYVIQSMIEMKNPSVAAMLLSQFEGHYVYLSKQKFSSHVVEKFLKFVEESRPRIINELVSEPHFDKLLQDPYANYVIQSALSITKGAVRSLLIQAVQPYKHQLRASPYCKKIFSRRLLKK